jgi:hypothetical protein
MSIAKKKWHLPRSQLLTHQAMNNCLEWIPAKMRLTPQQRADLLALTTHIEQNKANRENGAPKPKFSKRAAIAMATVPIAASLMWIYPGPQMREATKLNEQRAAAERDRETQHEKVRQEQMALQRERDKQAIATATKQQLTKLVSECQEGIRKKLAASPFEIYFTRYNASQFETMADIAQGMGVKTGRPSVALDDHDFNPVTYNVAMLSDPKLRDYWSISFVIEHALDGFSVQNYAALWVCPVNGLTPSEPRETRRFLF